MLELIFDTIVDVVCYHVGYATLWVVTLGRYPKSTVAESEKTKIQIVGFITMVVLLVVLYYVARSFA